MPPRWYFIVAVFFGFTAVVVFGLDCTGKPNGIYEYSCFYYLVCLRGVAVRIRCNSTEVFDPDHQRCIRPGAGYWPCTDVKNCDKLANNRYPDFQTGCHTYYTCHNGYYYGHNFCPEGLVYDPDGQVCNWPANVIPPCGTNGYVVG
ncbi:uncharacterized protein LOC124138750 [Haliotis rufescens]|uniref:uncharacterized protein LOC124138750 n=1 Tax=Haliotis rufescens TaxID=6454 RepID=UPI00201FA43C|nr:uncharacterized protein LOC124138750 [Haliotis rufescens]